MSTTVQHNNLLERNWSLGIWWGWHSFSSTKNNDTFTSNQIYLSLVYINELHLKHKMKYNFRISASFIFCANVSYDFLLKSKMKCCNKKCFAKTSFSGSRQGSTLSIIYCSRTDTIYLWTHLFYGLLSHTHTKYYSNSYFTTHLRLILSGLVF